MKKKLKKLTALILTAVMLASLAGCGKGTADNNDGNSNVRGEDNNSGKSDNSDDGSNSTQDTINIAMSQDVGSMNIFSTGTTATYVLYQIYEPLFDLGYDMEITPVLAESWEQVDDTHYTVKIRQGVTDSEGNTFTANDALFTLKLYQQDAENSQFVANIDLDKTTATDEYTLDIYLAGPNAYTFQNLSSVHMVTEAAWNASADEMVTDPVGTGAYVLKDYVSGSFVELEARDDYWGGVPSIKTARFTVISEPSQATTALETGEVQLVMSLQSSDKEYIDSIDGLTTLANPSIASMSLFFNMSENSVFSDKNLRQAICCAIDNEAINNVVYGGFALPSVSPYSTAMIDYVPEIDGEMYAKADMEEAKELVSASGLTGGKIKIATDGSSEQTGIAEIVQSKLLELGFEAEINNYDNATIWDVAADPAQWDIVMNLTAAPSGYGMDQLFAFLGGLNWSKWSGTEFDEFNQYYGAALVSKTDEERQENTNKAVKIVEDMCPTYSVVQVSNIYAFADNLNFRVWNQATLMVKDLKFE